MHNNVMKEDIGLLVADKSVPFDKLEGKTVLITGATGLIGKNLVFALAEYSREHGNTIKLLAFVRNEEKAKRIFENYPEISLVVGDIMEKPVIECAVDYIIHGASQTSSKAFVNEPVETLKIALQGTQNVLELAKEKNIESMVYLSSMEVYGAPTTEEKIDETYASNIDTMVVRSSYPESKRMCEAICASYAGEYGVPVKVARLTQTFGAGVEYNDGRVFAEFARCAIEKRDIVLHTKGETKRNYLYTSDAVSAIISILVNGENSAAYNVANEDTYCSIYDMACLVAKECADDGIKVVIEETDTSSFGYAPVLKMNLDTGKLKGLGWTPKVGLADMFKRLCESMLDKTGIR